MHRLLVIELWGTGRGLVHRTAPQTRLVTGALVFWACLVSAPETAAGLVVAVVSVAAWLVLTGLPRRTLGRLLVFGAAIFGPVFALTPWVDAAATSTDGCILATEALCVPWRIAAKGLACMLVATATASTLSLCAFYEALRRLPLPRLVVELLIQVTHQARLLVLETGRIRDAMAVRGAASGWRSSLLVVRSLPAVWLPRVLYRAERVAAAMELRAYGNAAPTFEDALLGVRDAVAVGGAAAWFLVSLIVRFDVL